MSQPSEAVNRPAPASLSNGDGLHSIVHLAARILRAPIAMVNVIDGAGFHVRAATGWDGIEGAHLARDGSLCADTILSASTLVVPDASTAPRYRDLPFVAGAPHIRRYAGHPIALGGGPAIGSLCVMDPQAGEATSEDLQALAHLAGLAARELTSPRSPTLPAAPGGPMAGMLDPAPDFVVLIDTHGRVVEANRTWRSRVCEIGDPLRPLLDHIHPLSRDALVDAILEVRCGKSPGCVEVLLCGADGGLIPTEAALSPAGGSTRATRILVLLRDIRGRVEAEGDRHAMWNYMQSLFCVMEYDGRVRSLNPHWSQVLGQSFQSLSARSLMDFIHPEDRGRVQREVARILETGGAAAFHSRCICADGTARVLEWNLTADPKRTLLYGVARDISNWTVVEDAHEVLSREIDRVGEGIAMTDVAAPGDRVVYASRGFEEITGYAARDICGRTIDLLFGRETDRDAVQFIRNAVARRQGFTTKILCRRKEAGTFWCDLTMSAPTDEEGKVSHLVWNLKNISGRQSALVEMRRAKELAEEADHAKSVFVANISHELRTPLGSIIGFAGLLTRVAGERLRPAELDYLERVMKSGRHLLHLVDGLLDLSKVEAGRMEVSLSPVDVTDVIREVLLQFGGRPADSPVSLEVSVASTSAPLETDAVKLKQILLNLIGNALKFTERGFVRVVLEVDPATRRPERIEVTDTGIGISPSQIDRVFDAFHQVDSTDSKRVGGTGLGLTLARAYCKMLGFRLTAESTPQVGSRFTVELAPSRAGDGPAGSAPNLRRVLLVGGTRKSARSLMRRYRSLGCGVVWGGASGEIDGRTDDAGPDLIGVDTTGMGSRIWTVLLRLGEAAAVRDIPAELVGVDRAGAPRVYGRIGVLIRPVTREALLRAVCGLVKPGPRTIRLLGPDPSTLEGCDAWLRDEGFRVVGEPPAGSVPAPADLVVAGLDETGLKRGLPSLHSHALQEGIPLLVVLSSAALAGTGRGDNGS